MCLLPGRPRGYRGRQEQFEMATWNCWGLTHERLQYVLEDVNRDVVVLTELRGGHTGIDSSRVIVSERAVKGDATAGVLIALSAQASNRVLAKGAEGSRVVWCRLAGLHCNQFVVGVYMPHKAKLSPTQDEVWGDVRNAVRRARPGDCITVMGEYERSSGQRDWWVHGAVLHACHE